MPPDSDLCTTLPIIVPTRVEPFPTQSVSSTLLVPGRKDFAAVQFDYENLSRNTRPQPLLPEQVPQSHILRPNHTHPHPAWSISIPDPDFSALPNADPHRVSLRSRIYETLSGPYSDLPDLEFLYLSYWVSEQYPDLVPSAPKILATASQWPGFHLPSPSVSFGSSTDLWHSPLVTISPSHSPSLDLVGFGGKWLAHDCGDNIIFGSAGNRRNACVFKAIGQVLPLTDWLVCLQTLRLAAEFHQALPDPLPSDTPSRFTDFARRTKDLVLENSPFDPITLVALSPPCLQSYRLVFLFVPSSNVASDPQVIVLNPPTGHNTLSTGFILLFERHAWALTPLPGLIESETTFKWWITAAQASSVSLSIMPYTDWPSFWRDSWPTGPDPRPPPAPLTFGGIEVGSDSGLGGRALNREGAVDGTSVQASGASLSSPPGELPKDITTAAKNYLLFQSRAPPEINPESWEMAISLGDRLVTICKHSIPMAIEALRSVSDPPGSIVPERNLGMMERFLELEVLPKELTGVKRDRAYNGVPSYFETPPTRQGPDSIQPSLRDHAVEGLNSIWEEYRTGKLFLISSKYREEHQISLPNSPLARVPKHDARGNLQPKGRIIRNHSFPRGRSINDHATKAPPGDIKLPTIQHLIGDYLFLRSLFPHQRILFAKCDVSGAFQWVGLHSSMIPFMGSYVEGPPNTPYLEAFSFPTRCTFGFLQSPAEWDIEAKAIGTYIAATRFQHPRRDGYWEPISREYVDDVMLMAPDIGFRPELTMLAAENTIKGLLGPSAINLKKHSIEGKWSTTAILLGFEFDSVRGTISLSQEKLEKARRIVNDPRFDWGSKEMTRHDLQVLQGSLHHWSQACRPIQGFTSGLLRILSKEGYQVDPSWASPESKALAWERLWADIRCIRMILDLPSLAGSPLTAPYLVALPPQMRMRLARQEDKFVVLGTDATEWSAAAVEFQERRAVRVQLPDSVPAAVREAALRRGLKKGITRKGEAICMAITELLSVLLGLLQWGCTYSGALVIVVTDNHSVLSWLRNRCAKNVYAQALLRLIIRMEIQGSYEIWAEDIRSEDNHLPDALSRLYDRQGQLDPTEQAKWEHYCAARGGEIEIQEVTTAFPSEWFTSPKNRDWTMCLPGESLVEKEKWDPTQRDRSGELESPLTPLETIGAPLSPKSLESLRERLDHAKSILKDNALASSTHAKYNSAFSIWTEFRSLIDKEPYLRGDPRENSEDVLDFIAYEGVLRSLKHGTVQGYLTGIRHYHIDAGLGDVTKHPKITATMKGLKKASGASIQKRPVTPQMLIFLVEKVRSSGNFRKRYVLGLAIMAFFFMLRGSEYSANSPGSCDGEKIIRRKDIRWKRNGKYINYFWLADEVEIHIRSSKTDQIGAGAFRAMKISGETLCVVKTMQEVYALGLMMEDSAPFAMMPDGVTITRDMVSELLKEAAEELGEPIDEFSSHSLRRGGATALYSKGYTREEIMYMGRWKSDVWLRYAKMTQEKLSSASKDIATASYTLACASSTSDSPSHYSGGPDSDLDRGMLAWYDSDPKDPGTFVLISTEHDMEEDRLLAHYIEVEVWDSVKRQLPKSPRARVRELKKNHTVLISEPREVEEWIAANPVLLHLGGYRQ